MSKWTQPLFSCVLSFSHDSWPAQWVMCSFAVLHKTLSCLARLGKGYVRWSIVVAYFFIRLCLRGQFTATCYQCESDGWRWHWILGFPPPSKIYVGGNSVLCRRCCELRLQKKMLGTVLLDGWNFEENFYFENTDAFWVLFHLRFPDQSKGYFSSKD